MRNVCPFAGSPSFRGSFFHLALLPVLLICPLTAHTETHPDFSGTWQQVNELTKPAPRSKSYSYRTIVAQHDSALGIDISVAGGRSDGELHLQYTIGGGEIVYTGLDHDKFHTTVHWRGQELIFDTVEYERGHKVLTTEVWTLLDGGQTLRRVKKENGPGEHSTSIYVLKRM